MREAREFLDAYVNASCAAVKAQGAARRFVARRRVKRACAAAAAKDAPVHLGLQAARAGKFAYARAAIDDHLGLVPVGAQRFELGLPRPARDIAERILRRMLSRPGSTIATAFGRAVVGAAARALALVMRDKAT